MLHRYLSKVGASFFSMLSSAVVYCAVRFYFLQCGIELCSLVLYFAVCCCMVRIIHRPYLFVCGLPGSLMSWLLQEITYFQLLYQALALDQGSGKWQKWQQIISYNLSQNWLKLTTCALAWKCCVELSNEMVGWFLSNCPRIGQCISNCPLGWQCFVKLSNGWTIYVELSNYLTALYTTVQCIWLDIVYPTVSNWQCYVQPSNVWTVQGVPKCPIVKPCCV